SAPDDEALPFQAVQIKASVMGGIVQLTEAHMDTGEQSMEFRGFIPLVGQGLALFSEIVTKTQGKETGEEQQGRPRYLFIGGSWEAPFSGPLQQDAGP